MGSLPEAAAAYIVAMGAGLENEKVQQDWDRCLDEIRNRRDYFDPPVKVEAVYDPNDKSRGGWKRGARDTDAQIRTERATGRLPKPPILSFQHLKSTSCVVEWELQEEPELWAEFEHMAPERLEPIFKFTLQLSSLRTEYDLTTRDFREGWAPGLDNPLPPPRPAGRRYETDDIKEYETIFEAPETEFRFFVRGFEGNSTYKLRVCSTNLHGDSDWSEELIITTPLPWEDEKKRGKKMPDSWQKKLVGSDIFKKVSGLETTKRALLRKLENKKKLFEEEELPPCESGAKAENDRTRKCTRASSSSTAW